jgi:mannose-6-phosphate isomerase
MLTSEPLYPLLFADLFKEKIWGGRRLETEFGRSLPRGKAIGESWEVSDRAPDTSIISNGPLRGTSLHGLLLERREDLLGPGVDLGRFPRFPLLIKFIDAHQVLSVQVHPPDDFARAHDPQDDGKTEMFYILAGSPGTVLYLGLRPGVTRADFQRAASVGGLKELLRPVSVAPGDCIFLPPGTVHAPGAGMFFAEVQQNSDLTYRVYDWDRVDADGRPRPLQLEKALAVIQWDAPREPTLWAPKVAPQPVAEGERRAEGGLRRELLVASAKFTAERWTLAQPATVPLLGRFHILLALDGDVAIAWPRGEGPVLLPRGRTALLPAALAEVLLTPRGRAVLLVARRDGEGG